MKKYLIMSAISLLFISSANVSFANGRPPKDLTSEKAGYACSTPKKGSGVVAGFFRGWKQTPFQDRGSGLLPVERYRCFSTMDQCQGWLRTMTYYYNAKTIDTAQCSLF